MSAPVYLLGVALLLVAGTVTIRLPVRRDYRRLGRLSPLTTILHASVFFAIGVFIWIDIESGLPPALVGPASQPVAWVLLAVGLSLMLGTTAWLGWRRSFGAQTDGLNRSGPYRFSRNPQTIAASLIMLSFALFWPTWHALGWIAVFIILTHVLVITEEELLQRTFGEEYLRYCSATPRYFDVRSRGEPA